jgi:hypothetical protein
MTARLGAKREAADFNASFRNLRHLPLQRSVAPARQG